MDEVDDFLLFWAILPIMVAWPITLAPKIFSNFIVGTIPQLMPPFKALHTIDKPWLL